MATQPQRQVSLDIVDLEQLQKELATVISGWPPGTEPCRPSAYRSIFNPADEALRVIRKAKGLVDIIILGSQSQSHEDKFPVPASVLGLPVVVETEWKP